MKNNYNSHISSLLKIQERLLNSASKMLKTGGIIVYSVCSLDNEEGHNQIVDFIMKNNKFEIDQINKIEIDIKGIDKLEAQVLLENIDNITKPSSNSQIPSYYQSIENKIINYFKSFGYYDIDYKILISKVDKLTNNLLNIEIIIDKQEPIIISEINIDRVSCRQTCVDWDWDRELDIKRERATDRDRRGER